MKLDEIKDMLPQKPERLIITENLGSAAYIA